MDFQILSDKVCLIQNEWDVNDKKIFNWLSTFWIVEQNSNFAS